MELSPLTQDARPDIFQPKIVQLYEQLLLHDDEPGLPSEGFWREFFLLHPDKAGLIKILDSISPDHILQLQASTQDLFSRAVKEAEIGISPQNLNAFENMAALLGGVLTKRYTNPSSDVIQVLAGLDEVDIIVTRLVSCIDSTVKEHGDVALRRSAIKCAIAMVSGAYKTGLVSYFTHKDLFPGLMKFVHDVQDPRDSLEAFLLLGLLANYNKFEIQNPYELRLDDFVNEDTIQRIVRTVGMVSSATRNQYVEIQDDLPESWNLNSTLIFLGLRAFAPEAKAKATPPTEEEAKLLFGALPRPEAALILSTYSFVNANKVFAANLATLPASLKSTESPFSAFLSYGSYLVHHAYRSERCVHYSILVLLTLRVITEDNLIMKRLSASESKIPVRFCRQRAPHLPLVTSDRIPLAVIMDICTTTLSHNLRKRLDVPLYSLSIDIILRIVTYLSRNKIRLIHHWSYIWGSLTSLIRFLTQYAPDLSYLPSIGESLCTPLTNLTAFCLAVGDTFLPDPTSYDDLFYKLIEIGPVLPKFCDAYNLAPPSSVATSATNTTHSLQILIKVSTHYHNLLTSKHGTSQKHQSPAAVAEVIKQGYETLDLPENTAAEFGSWMPWREGTEKALIKKIIRTVVEDSRKLAIAS